ncbi:hypothetical protein BMF94_3050, partial [Rhodotorula taiwanensis]
DQATGVQPFLYPLPPGNDVSSPLSLVLLPFSAVLGGARTLVFVLLLVAQTLLVEAILRPLELIPGVYAAVTRGINAGICRLLLAVAGIVWIQVDTIQLRKTGRSPPQVPFAPEKGDVIISNSSSWIDLLYLVFRYNATLTLPVSSSSSSSAASIVGWRRVSLARAIFSSGSLPEFGQEGETLAQLLENARGPVVVFPELTTSNNRAVLKVDAIATAATANAKPRQIYVLAFRYPAPTPLAPSLTHPIPTVVSPFFPLPLAHLYSVTSRLVPYTLTVRRLHPSESPKQLDWPAVAETLAATARLKRVGALGWKEKAAFLEFRKLKGR